MLPPPPAELALWADDLREGLGEGTGEVWVVELMTLLESEWGSESASEPPPPVPPSFFCNDPMPEEREFDAPPDHRCCTPEGPLPTPSTIPLDPLPLGKDPLEPLPKPCMAPLVPLPIPGKELLVLLRPKRELWQRCNDPGPGAMLIDDRDEDMELLGETLGEGTGPLFVGDLKVCNGPFFGDARPVGSGPFLAWGAWRSCRDE